MEPGLKVLWQRCLDELERELTAEQVSTWLRPLQASEHRGTLRLLAPNRYVMDQVRREFLPLIGQRLEQLGGLRVELDVGSSLTDTVNGGPGPTPTARTARAAGGRRATSGSGALNTELTFENFVEGKSNRLARAACMLVSEECGEQYNPLLIYGGVGLGKTHLLHAVGNAVRRRSGELRVVYVAAIRFVTEMIAAIPGRGRESDRQSGFERFRAHYSDADVLLMDDIQFLAGKDRSQEEFVHVLNALLDGRRQVVMTCDRYPKDIKDLEDRLKSRFGWGLTVAVEPPDLETRVAIILRKTEAAGNVVPEDVAFFLARRIHTNVRELEGALHRLLAFAKFNHVEITVDLAREALKDMLRSQDRLLTLDAIQRAVAEHFRMRTADLLSASRRRSVTRPRQIAMALAKELTSASLPEIGAAFGGRDHTTVLHACKRVTDLRQADITVDEDYRLLVRILTA